MKLQFLQSGCLDCPLIRLFGYSIHEVELLRAACQELAQHRLTEFALHEQPWVEAIDACKLILRLGPSDLGVRVPRITEAFVLEYSCEAWREVDHKLAPLADGGNGFNWLTNEGDVAVLISPDGRW